MFSRIGLSLLLMTGSCFAVNSSDVDFTISYQLNDVRFTTGPDAGTSAVGGGLDYEFYFDLSHDELETFSANGTGSFSTSSSLQSNGAPFDPDNDPFFEGDDFELTLISASSADSPGSAYSSAREGQSEFYADIYTSEGLEFIWNYTYTVATTVDNNDPDGGGSNAFADAEVDWFGEITPATNEVILDLDYGGLCCGNPTNPGESSAGQLSLSFAPGEIYATFSFVAEASTFNADLIPEPSSAVLALTGVTVIALRRRRR